MDLLASILEIAMLVCFGFSWPTSLVSNIKAKTAKNISLPFYLMIFSGYVAGIGAKLINFGHGSKPLWMEILVLAVYILNLLLVSANIVVYFRNRKLDQAAADAE